MTILQIALFNAKTFFRNFKSNAIMFALPIVFMGIFWFAFGRDVTKQVHPVGFVTADDPVYSAYTQVVKDAAQQDDADARLFDVKDFSTFDAAQAELEKGSIEAIVEWNVGAIRASGDRMNGNFSTSSAILQSIAAEFFKKDTSYFTVSYVGGLKDKSKQNIPFYMLVPGLIIYGLLIFIPGISQSFVEIREKNYIFRYFTSQVRASEIIFGYLLFYAAMVIVQGGILYATASAFGFKSEGEFLPFALMIIPSSIFTAAIGVLIGTFSRKVETATNLGSIISIILGFFSGSFIVGIGNIMKFDLFGRTFQFNDIFPSKLAVDALTDVMLEGKGLQDITTQLLVVSVVSVLMLVAGVILFKQKQLSEVE